MAHRRLRQVRRRICLPVCRDVRTCSWSIVRHFMLQQTFLYLYEYMPKIALSVTMFTDENSKN